MTKSLHRHYKSQRNEHSKIWSLGGYRKMADVTWRGWAFHVRAAAIGKAQSSTVDSHVYGGGQAVMTSTVTEMWFHCRTAQLYIVHELVEQNSQTSCRVDTAETLQKSIKHSGSGQQVTRTRPEMTNDQLVGPARPHHYAHNERTRDSANSLGRTSAQWCTNYTPLKINSCTIILPFAYFWTLEPTVWLSVTEHFRKSDSTQFATTITSSKQERQMSQTNHVYAGAVNCWINGPTMLFKVIATLARFNSPRVI